MLTLLVLGQVVFSPDGGGGALVRKLKCGGALVCDLEGGTGNMSMPTPISIPAACTSGQALTSTGSALACTSTLTADNLACSGMCVADAEISAVSGAKVSGAVATATALAVNPTACGINQWVNDIAADGTLACSQPAFSNISGTVAASQLPNPSAGALGGVRSLTCGGTDKLSAIGTDGMPVCSADTGGASPLTTKGDIYTFTTVDARLPVGADGLCLKANSGTATGLEYSSCSSGGGISYAEAAAAVMGGF